MSNNTANNTAYRRPKVIGDEQVRQHHLLQDAVLRFESVRERLLGRVDEHGEPSHPGTALVGIGLTGIRRNLLREFAPRRELHSAHPTCGITDASHWYNRMFRLGGGRMASIYHPDGTPDRMLPYLTDDVVMHGTGFGPAPVQMMIVDRRTVIVEGPRVGQERTALATSDHTVLAAAWRYWHRLVRTAVPVRDAVLPDPRARMTTRQREIVLLLADDHTDASIASRLGLSVRTVQYDVAAIMRLLGVRSRFRAGIELGRLGLHE